MAVGQKELHAPDLHDPLPGQISETGAVAVAPDLEELCLGVVFAQPGHHVLKVPGAVPAVQVGVHGAVHLPGLLRDALQGPALPVAVRNHQQPFHFFSSRSSASIFSQARARWLTAFFSSGVTSAKVLFRGS